MTITRRRIHRPLPVASASCLADRRESSVKRGTNLVLALGLSTLLSAVAFLPSASAAGTAER